MKFDQQPHLYVKKLITELPHMEQFILSFSSSFTNVECRAVNATVSVHFDDERTLEVKDSMDYLSGALNDMIHMIQKYSASEEDKCFANELIRLKNNLCEDSECPICGEALLHPFFDGEEHGDLQDDIDIVSDAILDSFVGGPIMGNYSHPDRTITLFVRNIGGSFEDYVSVFAHEYFHAMHYRYLDDNGCTEPLSRYFHTVVLESLATYFQIKYLQYRGFSDKAEEIERRVWRNSPIFYPYSGCRSLLNNHTLFEDVLSWTKDDFKRALGCLVDRYDYDIIIAKHTAPETDDGAKIKNGNCISASDALDILHRFFDGEWVEIGKYCDRIWLNGMIIHLFLVRQTENFDLESERGHLWAPQKGYPKMRDVKPGDIIFSCQNAKIRSINVALGTATDTFGTTDGWRIDCLYSVLTNPLDIRPLRHKLARYQPFQPGNGHLSQKGYIHHLHPFAAELLMNEIYKLGNLPPR